MIAFRHRIAGLDGKHAIPTHDPWYLPLLPNPVCDAGYAMLTFVTLPASTLRFYRVRILRE